VLKNPANIPDLDPDMNDFQNFISSLLSTDTSVVKISWRTVQQFLRDRRTNRQIL